ncbi:MAG: hypothetical protein EXR68_02135 [Dehalococcoidia bacterium]|nr:hypothetical protein [Dehalococcoidia bacterium]
MPERRRLPTPPDHPRFDSDFDGFEDDILDNSTEHGRGRRSPRSPRTPDDGGHEDAGLFRMLGILVLVAAVVVALVFPASPVRVIGRDGGTGEGEAAGQGISARARGDLPPLPPGLTAASRLYELTVPEGLTDAQVIEVALSERTSDRKNLGFYAYEGQTWKRLASASLTQDGKSVSGELPYPPKSVAVLRSMASARSLGLIVEGGQAPDARLLTGASVIAVRGAALGKDAKTLSPSTGALDAALKVANGKPVYLAVGTGSDAGASAQLGADLAASITAVTKAQKAGGVLVDLGVLPRDQRDVVSKFAAELSARLRAEHLGLLIAVPAAGRDGGAYDWTALLTVTDGIWLIPRVDLGAYYTEVDMALAGAQAAGIDTARVALVLDRRSQDASSGQGVALTRRDALALASTIMRESDAGSSGSPTVNLSAPFLSGSGGGLRWDDAAKAVTFTFTEANTTHAVWIENRFSLASRLDLAGQYGLGGVVVDQAGSDDGVFEIAETLIAFVQGGSPRLERPFGPYLAPCWQALGGGAFEGSSACWQQDIAAPSAVWRAPRDAGAYTVRLVVSDGTVFVGQELTLRVAAGGGAEPADAPSTAPTATATRTPTATATGAARLPGPAGN